ncbi:MAG TPA: hypothetical protein VFR64_18925 [Methylomirabilota bacterium]|nr:hypothetical protein [Methylomirabilota bacterium]
MRPVSRRVFPDRCVPLEPSRNRSLRAPATWSNDPSRPRPRQIADEREVA